MSNATPKPMTKAIIFLAGASMSFVAAGAMGEMLAFSVVFGLPFWTQAWNAIFCAWNLGFACACLRGAVEALAEHHRSEHDQKAAPLP